MLLNEIVPVFLRAKSVEGRAPATTNWYGWMLGRYQRWLDAQECPESWADIEIIELYIVDCRKELSPNSVAGAYRALNALFRWLLKRRVVLGKPNPWYKQANPLDDIEMQRPPRTKPRSTDVENYLILCASITNMEPKLWIDFRDLLAIRVMYLCGLRAAEVVGLEETDFNLDANLLLVRSGKGGDDRPAPLLSAVIDAFVYYRHVRPVVAHKKLFVSSYSNEQPRPDDLFTTSGLRQMLERRCAVAGITYLNPHSFRHGLAMRLLRKGGDMSLVQKVLGHAQISTTATFYAKWLTDSMIEKFSEIMENSDN